MNRVYLSVAGYQIEVKFHATEVKETRRWFQDLFISFFKEFFSERWKKESDFFIDIIWDQLQSVVIRQSENKYFINYYSYKAKNRIETYYQVSMWQLQSILRDILHELLMKDDGFILHGSASLINNQAYVFTGDSGAGKSTVVKLLLGDYKPLADDAIIIKKEGNTYFCYQTPFLEKEWRIKKSKEKIPLGKIVFLQKSKIFRLRPLDNLVYILENFSPQVFVSEKHKNLQLMVISNFLNQFHEFYLLSFAKDEKGILKLFHAFNK